MAMTVNYNEGSQISLGHLNKNSTEASKALARVSTGERITAAHDGDASSFAISERMRSQIRSLSQDTQNVQNGSSMVRIAERGIDQIVQNLRTMKEKAINAANDSNTDEDRATIQKEINQLRDTINDIALGTQYNGKILLDGRYDVPSSIVEPGVKNVVNAFKAAENATENTVAQMTNYTSAPSNLSDWVFEVDKSFTGSNFSVEMDFSAIVVEDNSYPDGLHNQGFSILCGGCPQYINVVFNANKTTAQSTYNSTANTSENNQTNNMAREFVIGVKDVESSKDLAEAVFQGISAVSGDIEKNFNSMLGYKSSTHENTAYDILVNAAHNLRIRRDPNDPSKILLTKESVAMQFRNGIIPNPNIEELDELEKRRTGPLWVQHGTQAGQHTNLYIKDMQTKSLGTGKLFDIRNNLRKESDIARYNALNDNSTKQAEWIATLNAAENKTIDDISVTTVKNANIAIRVIDGALEYALDQATTMGAYLQRLEYTETNVMTMNENVQASESTIRDADMAKEMANYTKYNVLQQASQAMLAQANQNSSSVLSLLQ